MTGETDPTPPAIEVDPSDPSAILPEDPRPRMPEPLPVRLMAVADVRLSATAGLERDLDDFYVGLLGFQREGALPTGTKMADRVPGSNPPPIAPDPPTMPPVGLGLRNREEPPPHLRAVPHPPAAPDDHSLGPVYLTENFKLSFDLVEGLVERDSYRPVIVEVPSLAAAEASLVEHELAYTRQRGLELGQESLMLHDPAGNQVELIERRIVG